MKKLLPILIKKFTQLLFIASLALPAIEANAQESDNDIEEETDIINIHREIALSLGNIRYTQPNLRNNDEYYSLLWRSFIQTKQGGRLFFFTDIEFASTPSDISNVDGLTREDQYLKLGGGYSFNKNNAPTTFFSSLGIGYIAFEHHVKGIAAWYPESDEHSFQNIIYENYGLYLEAGFGFKLQHRHKLSFYYIHTIPQQNLKARDNVHYSVSNNQPNHSVIVPDEIIDGMIGFRYSFLFWRQHFDRGGYKEYRKNLLKDKTDI